MQNQPSEKKESQCSPAIPASALGLLHKTAKGPYPSDSPYTTSRDFICHGIKCLWARHGYCYASRLILSIRASLMLPTYLICTTGPFLPSTGLTSDFAAI